MPKGIMIIPTIVFILIFIVGLLNAFNPRMIWKTFEGWKAVREPTAAFFMTRRLVGVATMLLVLCLFLLPYIVSRF